MPEIPESLLRRSAEAKAKALGLPVEQVLAEMKGEAPPTPPPAVEPEPTPAETVEEAVASVEDTPEPVEEVPAAGAADAVEPEIDVDAEADVAPAPPTEAPADADVEEPVAPASDTPDAEEETASVPDTPEGEGTPTSSPEGGEAAEIEPAAAAVATAVADRPEPETNGGGNGKVASVVTPRPVMPPKGTPEGVRTQRLLTVVKARAIQTVKAEPTDKVNTWPHLMLMEFGALLAITGLLVIMAVIIHSPLLDPANFNATPNPSKAPWYFLGLQELLSYFDPQIAGVTVPTITGIIGFMMIPFVDKNPSTRPSDRKFAIALYSVFLAGAATLTMFGVLFRGLGFNFSYPWKDGVFFDDLKDWVSFE